MTITDQNQAEPPLINGHSRCCSFQSFIISPQYYHTIQCSSFIWFYLYNVVTLHLTAGHSSPCVSFTRENWFSLQLYDPLGGWRYLCHYGWWLGPLTGQRDCFTMARKKSGHFDYLQRPILKFFFINASMREINGLFYMYWPLSLIHWALGSLWVFLFFQMVSLVLHLIKILQHGRVQLAFCWSMGYDTSSKMPSAFPDLVHGVYSLLLAATLEANIPVELSKHKEREESLCISVKCSSRSNAWRACSLGGLTSSQSLIQNVWHIWPEYCKQKDFSGNSYHQQPVETQGNSFLAMCKSTLLFLHFYFTLASTIETRYNMLISFRQASRYIFNACCQTSQAVSPFPVLM